MVELVSSIEVPQDCWIHQECQSESCKAEIISKKINCVDSLSISKQRNNFTSLQYIEQHIPGVVTLKITSCNVSIINKQFFYGLRQIENLYLFSNKIKHIEDNSFMEMQSLQTLKLGNNLIEKISSKLLTNLKELKTFAIKENQIGTIDPEAFKNNFKIEQIIMSMNKIKELHGDLLKNLSNLTTFNISRNEIQVIHPELLRNNEKLKFVDLSHNKIEKIDWMFAVNLKNIKEFNLVNNSCIANVEAMKKFFENCKTSESSQLHSDSNYDSPLRSCKRVDDKKLDDCNFKFHVSVVTVVLLTTLVIDLSLALIYVLKKLLNNC